MSEHLRLDASMFESMRTGSGLTREVLESDSAKCSALLEHRCVVHLAVLVQTSRPDAAVKLCQSLISPDETLVKAGFKPLRTLHALAADTALALRSFTQLTLPISAKNLYADTVSARRRALLASRAELTTIVAVSPEDLDDILLKVEDTKLRTTVEPAAFAELVDRINTLTDKQLDIIASLWVDDPSRRRTNHAVVIGAAVTDLLFTLPAIGFPDPNNSVQLDSFELHPGGKGLTQAVALRRLGLSVTLAAAVGDDENGRQIERFLEKELVTTTAVKVVPDQLTPVTAVITYQSGATVALGWKNESYVKISPQDIDRPELSVPMLNSQFVLLTFELPVQTMDRLLQALYENRHKQEAVGRSVPYVMVTPAPPYEVARLNSRWFEAIDLLVVNDWELRTLAQGGLQATSEHLAERLLAFGVRAVCLVDSGQTYYYSHNDVRETIQRGAVPVRDSAGERDALCAAVAYQVAQTGRDLSREQLEWATAAMAASAMFPGVAASMPTAEEVNRVYELYYLA